MSSERHCFFHRTSESLGLVFGLGYCDVDNGQAQCGGRVRYCAKPDLLRQFLLESGRRRYAQASGLPGAERTQVLPL
jgi:hypothetical protein